MNRLGVRSHYLDEHKEIIVIEPAGVLDHETFPQLEAVIQTYLEQEQPKFILDLKFLQVLTPYALGFLNGLLKFIRLHQSDLVFLGSGPHIKKDVLEAYKTQHIKVFASMEEAREYIIYNKPTAGYHHFKISPATKSVVSGVPFQCRIEAIDPLGERVPNYAGVLHVIVDAGMVYPSMINTLKNGVWEGKMIVTKPGNVRIRVWDDDGAGTTEVAVRMEGQEVEFPIAVNCPGCHMGNVAGKTDVFRCIHCNAIYFVDKYGHIIPLRPGQTSGEGIIKRLEFVMPSDVNYLNHVRNFIVGISSEERIDDEKISQIEMSLDEALANIIEHAYSYDAYQQINIIVTLYKNQLEIVLRDQGRSFDSKNTPLPDLKKHIEERRVGGLGRYLMKTLMDDVDYKSDGRFNELRMVKKF